ncbi:MAG: prolipoprotein diacylglyceryl transferase [Thermoleophilia bacterium]|nr:prolipoprotein diacylglyceryl transferase [Thermoleophilia bacterium]
MLATIPAPPFQNIDVGPLTLHGYGLVMGLAIIVALSVLDWALRYQQIDVSALSAWAAWAVVGGFVGARLYHVASEPIRYAHHPDEIVQVWNGGLGIYGAIVGGAATGFAVARRYRLPPGALADAAAPAMLIAQGIGRIGNYLNQELYGKPSHGPLSLHVDRQFRPADMLDQATYQPTFLYEAIGNLVLFLVAVWALRRWTTRAPGILFPLYIAAYSAVRMLVEPLRIDHANHWLGVRQNVWVAGILIVVSLAVAVIMQRRSHASDTTASLS